MNQFKLSINQYKSSINQYTQATYCMTCSHPFKTLLLWTVNNSWITTLLLEEVREHAAGSSLCKMAKQLLETGLKRTLYC